ncbi:MAG: hypothetical protein LBN08_02560 [Lactobacillales bacterium]|jgi:ribosomal protein S18 acetylase RimI-like enzyme|nr:hypothetical protein [Lactobacillales bacterium]
MAHNEYNPKDLVLVNYKLVDKREFEHFDSGNILVNHTFHTALYYNLLTNPNYESYCLIPNAGSVIIGFFSISKSTEFELAKGYEFVKDFSYVKIDWFGVDQKYHYAPNHPGYGKHLMYHALKTILANYPDTEIICLEAKDDAIVAYESYGFSMIEDAIVDGGADMFLVAEAANLYIAKYESNLNPF